MFVYLSKDGVISSSNHNAHAATGNTVSTRKADTSSLKIVIVSRFNRATDGGSFAWKIISVH